MLEFKNVSKTYQSGFAGAYKTVAIRNVSFKLKRGTTLGLVGNSGCGKSTIAKIITGLINQTEGQIILNQKPIENYRVHNRKNLGKTVQMVFQHPESALNPKMTIFNNLMEPILIHKLYHGKTAVEKIEEKMAMVGLASRLFNRYPHEVSGGEAQRIGIARALLVEAELLILDEPTSMLDISVQSQTMNLLARLQKELGLTYLFISHDLEIVQLFSDDLCIMQNGIIVESGKPKDLIDHPKDPFTQSLVHTFKRLTVN